MISPEEWADWVERVKWDLQLGDDDWDLIPKHVQRKIIMAMMMMDE